MTASDHIQKTEDGPSRRPLIVFLDQNKWIDLARAVKAPDEHRDDRFILERLCVAVVAGEVSIPLTASNLYETQKVNDFELRATIAHTQAVLSGGRVYRGRRRRLQVEATRVLAGIYERPWVEPDPDWVFSSLFFEASAEAHDPAQGACISQAVLDSVAGNPQAAMFDYLLARDEAVRQQGLLMFEAGAERLRANIEERRARNRDQPVSMKRKIQGVLLFDGDQDTLISAADALNLPWRCFADNKGATLRKVVAETPALAVEREMVLTLEGQRRAIHVNDFCDMQNFTTILPYADVVVAEKQFVNLARQAGMATRFEARMETKLSRALPADEMARCRVPDLWE